MVRSNRILMLLWMVWAPCFAVDLLYGGANDQPQEREVMVELFVGKDCQFSAKAKADLAKRTGLHVKIYDVTSDGNALKQLYALAERHHVKVGLPMINVCRRVYVGYDEPATTGAEYDRLLAVEIFTREGCPRCAAVKALIKQIAPVYPGLDFKVRDVIAEPAARQRLEALNQEYGIRVPSLPSVYLCGELLVGYMNDATTGAKIRKLLEDATIPQESKPLVKPSSYQLRRSDTFLSMPLAISNPALVSQIERQSETSQHKRESLAPANASIPPALPAGDTTASQPPPLPLEQAIPPTETIPPDLHNSEEIHISWIGKLNAQQLGMPLFTIFIGLVDGFNPCAMWVLLFLLSILVNLQDRRKILAVAGTFVFVSGLVYFAFMAAWMNVFLLIGYRRWSEVVLSLIAIVIGAINVKDFFAFKQGLTLSIPESAKPSIYARVRNIVMAPSITTAIIGAIVLAVLVNMVELLCTAGLPALYTKVLTMQGYSRWGEYAYLGLYNIAYMFDDSLMVAIAILTLSRHKLQEHEGRWLKLISGLAIFGLGLILLFAPQWLV